jgi:uncharacterized protein YdaT
LGRPLGEGCQPKDLHPELESVEVCHDFAIYEAQEVIVSKPGQHVVPKGDKWSVRKAGASRASAIFETQREAIDEAKKIAKNQGTELYIHGKDGRIRERNSYGSDPHPPTG